MKIGILAKQSLILDFKFIKISKWNIIKKIVFIIKKYIVICKHFFFKFELGESYIYLFGEKIYYGSPFGLADYQSILTRHQNMFQISGFNGVNTVIDIGANMGFFSKLFRDLFPLSTIYTIEPIPNTFKCLKLNFDRDINTKIFNLAISDHNGISKMSWEKKNSLVSKLNDNGDINVTTQTLDSFVKENNILEIDILKIDTEGFEAHVLKGSKHALSITKYLFIEITIDQNINYSISSIMSLLYSNNYNFQLIAFRNYGDTSEGKMPIMDCLLKNTLLIK